MQVPTAVSLSFHAMQVSLPADATLVVRGAQTTTTYRASDLHRGELWSRVQPGAGLQFALSVPAAERARVKFRIVSLQAGYRSLGAGVIDHPYYRQLRARTDTTSQDSLCITNYECKVTAANTAAAAATVALLIENQFECSGTLINDVPQDNTPYVLSARHCISGKVGVVDDPTAAAATSVYWDATSTCGATLGSIYDPTTPLQTGAQTVVEQQDAWLIRLDAEPVVSDAQFAGFDASGSAVSGGYTIHHAEGYNKQFVAWFGQAASVQQVTGWPHFLETVNQTGNIGPGASGSALFDQNNHLVGSLTFGPRQAILPVTECAFSRRPGHPTARTASGFHRAAAVWTSPSHHQRHRHRHHQGSARPSGHRYVGGRSAPAIVISFFSSTLTQIYGQPLQLTWSASGATQCVASGGLNGDGWSGTVAAAGSQPVTEQVITNATYLLTCTYPGGRTGKTSVGVNWVGPIPQLSLMANPETLWTTLQRCSPGFSMLRPACQRRRVSQTTCRPRQHHDRAGDERRDYLPAHCGRGATQTVGALVEYVTPRWSSIQRA